MIDATKDLLKLGILQTRPEIGSIDHNIKNAARMFKKAALSGAELIMFPELFHVGYDLNIIGDKLCDYAQTSDGPLMDCFSILCRRYNICAVVPFIEIVDDRLYNSVAWIDYEGTVLHIYQKKHLWDIEKEYFTPGTKPPCIIDSPWGKIALMICYDVDFPEMSRYAALNGARLMLLPTAWAYENKDLWEIFLPARAAENMMYLAAANLYQPSPSAHMFGNSKVINPRGTTIAQLPVDCEDVLICEIDLSKVKEYRLRYPYLTDRSIDFQY